MKLFVPIFGNSSSKREEFIKITKNFFEQKELKDFSKKDYKFFLFDKTIKEDKEKNLRNLMSNYIYSKKIFSKVLKPIEEPYIFFKTKDQSPKTDHKKIYENDDGYFRMLDTLLEWLLLYFSNGLIFFIESYSTIFELSLVLDVIQFKRINYQNQIKLFLISNMNLDEKSFFQEKQNSLPNFINDSFDLNFFSWSFLKSFISHKEILTYFNNSNFEITKLYHYKKNNISYDTYEDLDLNKNLKNEIKNNRFIKNFKDFLQNLRNNRFINKEVLFEILNFESEKIRYHLINSIFIDKKIISELKNLKKPSFLSLLKDIYNFIEEYEN